MPLRVDELLVVEHPPLARADGREGDVGRRQPADAAGVLLACIAAIFGIIDLATRRYFGTRGAIWLYVGGNVLALILAILASLIHTRDAWTSVVPWGLALSAATVIVLLASVIFSWVVFNRLQTRVAP